MVLTNLFKQGLLVPLSRDRLLDKIENFETVSIIEEVFKSQQWAIKVFSEGGLISIRKGKRNMRNCRKTILRFREY